MSIANDLNDVVEASGDMLARLAIFAAYSHAWRSLNNIHADHSITSMPIAQ
ncbi:hypothetical protein AB6N02_00350 [Aeromonas caviae]|uniref:hypothetical protein n=1 Tax=Aeromonas caviae TaxID=648 RepID=UPI0034E0D641